MKRYPRWSKPETQVVVISRGPGFNKSVQLLKENIAKYDWKPRGNGVFHQERLHLILEARLGKVHLYSTNNSSKPCIASIPGGGIWTADDIVAVIYSCQFDKTFIAHIGKFDPSYPRRLKRWLNSRSGPSPTPTAIKPRSLTL